MKKIIIQLRDDRSSIISADIIEGMIAIDHLDADIIIKNDQYANLILFIGGKEKSFFYTIETKLDYKYYQEDAKNIRFALNKIGGNL